MSRFWVIVLMCSQLLSTAVATASPKATASLKSTASASNSSPAVILIRGANVILKVEDFQSARARVLKVARKYDAHLRDARTEVDEAGQKHGQLVLQLSSSDLSPVVNELRGLGKLYSEHVQTIDQTKYYDQLGQRIDLLKQNENELVGFLKSPRRMRGSDILFVQSRLFQTRVEASDALQERLGLQRGDDISVIQVELFEPEPKRAMDWRNWHALAAYKAKSSFLYTIRKLITGLYFIGWFAPFWIPTVIVLFFLLRWVWRKVMVWWRSRPRRAAEVQAQETE